MAHKVVALVAAGRWRRNKSGFGRTIVRQVTTLIAFPSMFAIEFSPGAWTGLPPGRGWRLDRMGARKGRLPGSDDRQAMLLASRTTTAFYSEGMGDPGERFW